MTRVCELVEVRTKDGQFIAGFDPTGLVERLGELAKNDPTLRTKIDNYKTARGLNNENGGQQ